MLSSKDFDATREDIVASDSSREILFSMDPLQREHEALKERFQWLEAMVNQVPDFIFAKDLEGRFLYANEATVRNNGFDTAAELVGLTDFDIHGPETAQHIADDERRVMTSGHADLGTEERRVKGDGWLMMSRVPLRNQEGKVVGIVGASRDISARKRAEMLMQAHAAILQEVASGLELRKLVRHVTNVLGDILPEMGASIVLGTKRSRKKLGTVEFPITASGTGSKGVLLVAETVQDDKEVMEFLSSVSRTIGIAIDRDRDAKQISFLADHDSLTGLLNRTALDRRLATIIRAASADATNMAIAFVDIDNFKLINDNLGHIAGDELLKIVADRIRASVGNAGLVSRIGGDEFIVVLTSNGTPFDQRLEDIWALVAEPVTLVGMKLHVTCSIGVACLQHHGKTATELFAAADMALYSAKANGRNYVQMFSSSLGAEARKKLVRSEELRKAIELNELIVHYQPQIDAQSGRISGVEALVRWQHPTRGLVAPGEFIPLAEETGLILAIGDFVLTNACCQARAWLDAGFAPITMAVNMSARQFRDAAVVTKVSEALVASGLPPRLLEIEVTETLLMQDMDAAIATMHALTSLGVSLSLDDFGTGYSSLSRLKRFPISKLKVDKAFVDGVPHDKDDRAIVGAVVALAKALELEVIAEGVENTEQADFLKAIGCDVFQGYLFARPSPAVAIEGRLPIDESHILGQERLQATA